MNQEEWEALCDGCGLCCLFKLDDEGQVEYTSVACRLLDIGACRCTSYANRFNEEQNCIPIDFKTVAEPNLLPRTCAYRLLFEGKALKSWHPLRSNDPATVKEAGISVSWFATSADEIDLEDIDDYILEGAIN